MPEEAVPTNTANTLSALAPTYHDGQISRLALKGIPCTVGKDGYHCGMMEAESCWENDLEDSLPSRQAPPRGTSPLGR